MLIKSSISYNSIGMSFQPGFQPPPGPGSEGGPLQGAKQSFSTSQLQQLRVQIMAYRLLARNQPLSQQLALAVQGMTIVWYSSSIDNVILTRRYD